MYSGPNTDEIVERAFNVKTKDHMAVLPGVVSRKKQVIPALMTTIQSMQEDRA